MGFEPTAKLVVDDPAEEIGAFARQVGPTWLSWSPLATRNDPLVV
jgi:hypothetical protein